MTLKWAKTTKNYAKMGKQNVQKRQKWLKMSKTGQYVLKWPKITKKYAKLRNKMWKQWVKMTKIEQKWAKMTKKCIKLSKNGETMGKQLVK